MRTVKLTTIILSILLVNCSNFQLSTISPFYEFYTDKDDRLCLSKYPDRLLYSSSSTKCQLNCSWFSSSSPEYSDYYNDNQVITYSLNHGKLCDLDSYCKSGSCVHLNDIPGRARLTIGQCFFPQKDTLTETDSYIRVYVNSNLSGPYIKLIGTTSIIYNNNNPNFEDDSFDSPLVSREGFFLLSIKDKDYVAESDDDFIARIKIKFTDCYMESKYCKVNFYDRYWLKYKISWTPSF